MQREFPPSDQETLDAYQLAGRSLAGWHRWLCVDQETGVDQTLAQTPCSRYGNTASDTAFFALAAAIAHLDARPLSEYETAEELVGYLQGLAVKDSPDVARMIFDSWHLMPQCLKEEIGDEGDVGELL